MTNNQFSTFDIDTGSFSSAGIRQKNDDFASVCMPKGALLTEKGIIALVADGVSSDVGGDIAAKTTGQVLVEDFYATPVTWEASVSIDRILQAQNAWLYHHSNHATSNGGHATTLTALNIRGHFFTVAHIGDTRAYLIRREKIDQLTRDHVHGAKDLQNVLTRAMGVDAHLLIDYTQGLLEVGDVYVITSDGVHKSISDKILLKLVLQTIENNGSANDIAKNLCEKALQQSSQDNVSAAVVIVKSLGETDLRDNIVHAKKLMLPPALKASDTFENMTVVTKLADNGTNIVYKMEEPLTKKLFVLKTIVGNVPNANDEREALAHEIWLGERLHGVFGAEHFPNVINLRALLQAQGVETSPPQYFYGLFEFYTGKTLEQIIESKKLPNITASIQLAISLCRSLSAISRLRVVHRDIKPANLHLGTDNVLRLIDWGSALSGFERGTLGARAAGTPSYMPAELWQNTVPDHATDVYAACVTLYELITGHLPYGTIEPYQTGAFMRVPRAPSRIRPEVPKWLDKLLLKGISTDKAQRFTTSEELLLALESGDRMRFSPVTKTPILMRDKLTTLRIFLAISIFINFALILAMLVIPK